MELLQKVKQHKLFSGMIGIGVASWLWYVLMKWEVLPWIAWQVELTGALRLIVGLYFVVLAIRFAHREIKDSVTEGYRIYMSLSLLLIFFVFGFVIYWMASDCPEVIKLFFGLALALFGGFS